MKKILFLLCLVPLLVQAQTITTYAGGGTSNIDGIPATNHQLYNPGYVKFDTRGNCYISSALGHKLYKISPAGIIKTIAGTGIGGYNGDNILATSAQIKQPCGILITPNGDIYFGDGNNHRVRKIDFSSGIITTVVGTGVPGNTGNGGAATSATIYSADDICIDKFGNIYIADFANSNIRKVTTAGVISNFAGNGLGGYSGDGCRADTSKIGGVFGVCTDTAGSVYLANNTNSIVIKVKTDGTMVRVAGVLGSYPYNGDGIPATNAQMNPGMVAIENNELYIVDQLNQRIRRIDGLGIIHTVAGIGGAAGYSGDGGPATSAQFNKPDGITWDTCGNMYISEAGNNRVRKITYDTSCGKPADTTNHHVGIATVSKGLGIGFYPNPVYSTLHVDAYTAGVQYSIVSVAGAVAQSGGLHQGGNDIPVGSLPSGIYVLQLVGVDGSREMYRVVKE